MVLKTGRVGRHRLFRQVQGGLIISGANGDFGSQAAKVGALVAERARAAGISRVVFDRGGNQYAGRIAALATAAREAGLEF